jgi:hypothetical protein
VGDGDLLCAALVAQVLDEPRLAHGGRRLDKHDLLGRTPADHLEKAPVLFLTVYEPVYVLAHRPLVTLDDVAAGDVADLDLRAAHVAADADLHAVCCSAPPCLSRLRLLFFHLEYLAVGRPHEQNRHGPLCSGVLQVDGLARLAQGGVDGVAAGQRAVEGRG